MMKAKIKGLFLVSVLLLCRTENVVASEETPDFIHRYVRFYEAPLDQESACNYSPESLRMKLLYNATFIAEIEKEASQRRSSFHEGILSLMMARALLERESLYEAIEQPYHPLDSFEQPEVSKVGLEVKRLFEKAKKFFEKEIKFGENDEFQRDNLNSQGAYLLFFALTLRSLESLTKEVPQKLAYLTQLFDAVNELRKATLGGPYFEGIRNETVKTIFLELGYGKRENFQNLSLDLQITHILFTISLKENIFKNPESVTATLLRWTPLLDPSLAQILMEH
jgi:hypothetical protein